MSRARVFANWRITRGRLTSLPDSKLVANANKGESYKDFLKTSLVPCRELHEDVDASFPPKSHDVTKGDMTVQLGLRVSEWRGEVCLLTENPIMPSNYWGYIELLTPIFHFTSLHGTEIKYTVCSHLGHGLFQ